MARPELGLTPEPLSGNGDRHRAVFGTDAAADVSTLTELMAFRLAPGRGYTSESVERFRTTAINTVDVLEDTVVRLRTEVAALRSRLTTPLGPEALSRGLALLAMEMRRVLGPDDPALRNWFASELAVIVGAADAEVASDAAEQLPERVSKILGARDKAGGGTDSHGHAQNGHETDDSPAGDWLSGMWGPRDHGDEAVTA